jgi:hypothetical protein
MSLIVKRTTSEGGFEPLEAGSYPATVYMLVDLGKQTVTWEGVSDLKHQLWIGFEIGGETRDDGKPLTMGKKVNLSFNEKSTLFGMVKSLFPGITDDQLDEFDLTTIIGKSALVTISHYTSRDGYARAKLESTLTPLPKGVKAPQMRSEPLVYTGDESDVNTFARLPEWLQKVVDEGASKPAPQTGESKFSQEELDSAPF